MISFSVFQRALFHGIAATLICVTCNLQAFGKSENSSARETQDRRVDRVALQSKQKAIAQLNKLLLKYVGTQKESLMLMKLAEYQQQASAIEFRIAHGDAHRYQTSPNLSKYTKSLEDVILSTTRIITRFKNHSELDHVYFMRASAYEELQKIELAKSDYLVILDQFKDSIFGPQANMAIAEHAIEANHYPEAIQHLMEVEKLPEDPHFPFALYKLAWSHYNLKNFERAIGFLERHVDYYHNKEKEEESNSFTQSDRAILEHSLLDIVTFYTEGAEAGISAYSEKNALETFRKLETGPILGPMLLRYAKLLRTHGRDEDLFNWKNKLLEQEFKRSETLGVLLISFEYFFNSRQFDKVLEESHNFKKLDDLTHKEIRKSESYLAAQKMLLDTADRLQKMTIKNKGANQNEVNKLIFALNGIYQAFISIVDEKDPRVPMAHYNLAEILFEIKDYDQSSQHYHWVTQNWNSKMSLNKKEIHLKLISSRYHSLDHLGIIPKKLNSSVLKEETQINDQKLDPKLAEWIHWIDDYKSNFEKTSPEIENFEFEADRSLYSQNQVRPATDRLLVLLSHNPDTKFFIPSASLILDTYIVSQAWENVHQLADKISGLYKKSKTRDSEFEKKIAQIGGDAFYKVIETAYKSKDYQRALQLVDQFKDSYSTYPRYSDTLFLASRIAMDIHNTEQAYSYLGELLTRFPKSENHLPALLVRAALEEERYEFEPAAQDYATYLTEIEAHPKATQLSRSELLSLNKKLFQMRWLSSSASALDCKPYEKNEELSEDCDRYQALIYVKWPDLKIPSNISLIKKALHGPKNNRSPWAALALKHETELTFHDRLLLARVLASTWGHLDPLAQFATIPVLSENLNQAIGRARQSLSRASPLRADGKSIERRIGFMGEIENTATQIVKLPWARIKAEVLGDVARMYIDFSDELSHLPVPKEISGPDLAEYHKSVQEVVNPFREKGQKLRDQAIELATDFTVQKEVILAIQPELPVSDPNRKVASKPITLDRKIDIKPIDLGFFTEIEQTVNWKKLDITRNSPLPERIEYLWFKSLKQKDISQLGFFIQEMKDKASPSKTTLKLMRSTALFAAGAQSESLDELDSIKSSLEEPIQRKVNETLYSYYVNSRTDKKAKKILSELERPKNEKK